MSKCHSAMFEGDSSIRNNVLHANDQFRQKYFHNHIFHWKSLLGRALRAIPFWSNKYASRTRTHFAMRPLFVFFSPVLAIRLSRRFTFICFGSDVFLQRWCCFCDAVENENTCQRLELVFFADRIYVFTLTHSSHLSRFDLCPLSVRMRT